MRVTCLVEGQGEVNALPVLARRIAPHAEFPRPFRLNSDSIFSGDWSAVDRYVQIARAASGSVLLLLDTDREMERCPRRIAATMTQSLQNRAGNCKAALVLAENEFETWFLEGADLLHGVRGLASSARRPSDPLGIRDAKKWLSDRLPSPYQPTVDQAAFAARLDIDAVRQRSRSFRKLCEAVAYLTT